MGHPLSLPYCLFKIIYAVVKYFRTQHVLVDLYTVEEGASDLVLAMRVYEKRSAFEFEILSVYVP